MRIVIDVRFLSVPGTGIASFTDGEDHKLLPQAAYENTKKLAYALRKAKDYERPYIELYQSKKAKEWKK